MAYQPILESYPGPVSPFRIASDHERGWRSRFASEVQSEAVTDSSGLGLWRIRNKLMNTQYIMAISGH